MQKNAIKYYYEVDKRLKTDIRDVIKQIEEELESEMDNKKTEEKVTQ